MIKRGLKYLAAVVGITVMVMSALALGIVVALALADWYFSVTR